MDDLEKQRAAVTKIGEIMGKLIDLWERDGTLDELSCARLRKANNRLDLSREEDVR